MRGNKIVQCLKILPGLHSSASHFFFIMVAGPKA